MIAIFTSIKRRLLPRLYGRPGLDYYKARGLVAGDNVHVGPGCRLDPSHCWLISLADDVTLGPNVTIVAHDASTKMVTGRTFVAPVVVEQGAFLGTGSIILPGVTVGKRAIVAAGSVVTHDVQARTVVAGNPARTLCSLDEFQKRQERKWKSSVIYPDQGWTLVSGITNSRKKQQRMNGPGYVP